MALRHPAAVRGLLLWRVTGGAFAARRLVENYYTQFIETARTGGMEAVCRTDHFAEMIKGNPANRARLSEWVSTLYRGDGNLGGHFDEGADHPVIGLSPAELRSMTMPACIIPGTDRSTSAVPTRPRRPIG